ncbi:carbohydrate ABC transporter membrane protein 1 (CUT1 family) [Asanoa ferruginea]|uniref:Carbohydrate ABC transporter membrane protein 1 (CUT1 family) n=1 Tax=Asanoa ferruginea TaxID=53367 RepID=A0A3D9ZBT7_9ACTN|nr:sugar ABC transporter permease [Asanoa ferruginea]REF94707.1 carbohydrate ABC transporter membrane protein 1 (CUT1 family) [Asanoa ferruginea]GIF45715.1 permease [Asanoa ferruginea]
MTATASTKGRKRGTGWSALGFISPAVLVVAVLLYAPFLYTIFYSFTDYDGLTSPKWVALDNFKKFLDDPALTTSIRNTLFWVVGTTIVPVAIGLLIALLSFGIRGGTLLRLPFMLPYALSGAGLGVIWGFILQSDGAANDLLHFLHLPGADISFLQQAPYNTIAMIVAMTWQQSGVNALLFLVGLQSIPVQPLEAARLDGASGWKMFRHITWPLLAPLTTVVVGLSLVASLKTFDIVWVTTQGGPGRSSETLAVTMYRDAFVSGDYGYGSAVALVLTLVTGAVTIAYLRFQIRGQEKLR